MDGIEDNLDNNPGGNIGGYIEDNIWQEIASRVADAETRNNISTPGELHLVELGYATILICCSNGYFDIFSDENINTLPNW